MRFRVQQTANAPRQAVFDVISDPRRRLEWQSSLRSLQMETAGAPGLGTRWSEVTQGGIRFDMEITTYEPPARWAERGCGWLADAELTVSFHETGVAGDATRVEVEVNIAFKGPFKVLGPVVSRLMPSALAKDVRRAGELAREASRRGPV
jgi:uncharacterized protein YndB with AHSA1/START domain